MSYHDPFRAGEREEEEGRRGGGGDHFEPEGKGKKRRGEGYCRTQARRVIRSLLLSKIVGVRIYPLTLAMALAQHLVRWGERRK